MKLLFISRAYPPVVGGLEKHNQALFAALRAIIPVQSILNRKGKKALPFFLPLAMFKVLFCFQESDVILLGDGLLGVLGWFIKLFRPNTPVICIIHGLDITYGNPVYQFFWIRFFLPNMDRLIAVSQATSEAAILKGLPASKLTVIPNGVHQVEMQPFRDRQKLDQLLGVDTENKAILFTLGRLVKRKGVSWFIRNVMTKIQDQCIYIVAGDGPEKAIIDKSIQEYGLEKSVFCCGFTTEELKGLLFANADLFIQPNIKVTGDMEGFGIAVLEANAHGLAVLGSNLEGLQDSITENQNGWLLEPENAAAYIQKISELLKDPSELQRVGNKAKRFCHQHFSWEQIANQYFASIANLAAPKHNNKTNSL
ncbi:glycosyltransferase family 4 protein [Methylotuvimicrobium sp. KM1]|uniref:glycosyltransferase family 4 protein n=1 Tax=Methylotuvimicrobium sp. KM1 TaxID=3377707 RepID=UPI00384D11B7